MLQIILTFNGIVWCISECIENEQEVFILCTMFILQCDKLNVTARFKNNLACVNSLCLYNTFGEKLPTKCLVVRVVTENQSLLKNVLQNGKNAVSHTRWLRRSECSFIIRLLKYA